jgi:hypothetical protein
LFKFTSRDADQSCGIMATGKLEKLEVSLILQEVSGNESIYTPIKLSKPPYRSLMYKIHPGSFEDDTKLSRPSEVNQS